MGDAVRRAAKVDENQDRIVKALRAYGCLVAVLSGAGVPGLPDLLIAAPGNRRLGLIEIKNPAQVPSKRVLTEDQIRFWDEWQGTAMAIVESEDEALRFARRLTFE